MSKIVIILFISFSFNAAVAATINPKAADFKSWVSYLASDEMKGRLNGSKEAENAAHWIATQFQAAGLVTAPGMDSYFQSFPKGSDQPTRNVIAYFSGSNPNKAQEYIILSAHYDHIGTENGIVFNGADDNASGVSALIGIANHLQRVKPERSVLFIAMAGEEQGLLGSKHYVSQPILPLENAVLNLNFEMVGHTEGLGKKQFWMTGTKYSSVYENLKSLGKKSGWRVSPSPYPEMKLFWRSDNVSFALLNVDQKNRTAYGIPAHSISTWGKEGHYHSPSDDIDALDYENLAMFAETISNMIVELSSHPVVAKWHENSDIMFKHYKAK